jgi:putative peptide modification system cyclase
MNDAHRPTPAAPQVRTLLLTDLVDSTTLVERLGDAQAAELFREHDRLVLDLQQRWRGRLIDRSDGMLLLFERPIDGLAFALDYARGLRAMGEARTLELRARAGLHVGEVLTWRNSAEAVQAGAKPLEVEGLAKPLAGRLMTLARPGQILLSATAEPLARRAARELGERGEHLIWKSHGRWRFKGMPDSQEIFEVGEPGHAPLRAPSDQAKAWRDIPLWRRPAALAAEVLLLVGLGTGAWFLTRPQPAIAFGERDWVVVGDLRNLTGQTVLDDSLEQAFRISLEQSRHVNVLSDLKARDTLQRMRREPDTALDRTIASEIALRDGARAVILPTVAEVGGRVRVSAEVVDPHTQTTVYAESADGVGAGSALASIDTVTAALRARLGEAMAAIERDSTPLPEVTTQNLDALRAYALGQEAYGRSRYAEASGFYERATKLDPEFALAYVGLLRAHNAQGRLSEGMPHFQSALALRSHLPSRDQVYLEAWAAQSEASPEAVDRWREMARLYPDFFPASANVGYALFLRNRFNEALPHAQRAASSRYEFARLAQDLSGQSLLALSRYKDADKAFDAAIAGVGRPSTAWLRRVDSYAAQERYADADKAWRQAGQVDPLNFNRTSYLLDRGQWSPASDEAARLVREATPATTRAIEAAFVPAVVAWIRGDRDAASKQLDDAATRAMAAVQARSVPTAEAANAAYVGLSAALLAQRMGDQRLARVVSARLSNRKRILATAPVDDLWPVVQAYLLQSEGKPREALSSLEAASDGSERYQARVARMELHAAQGRTEKALADARWLSAHRGLAFAELGCGWCQQPMNVVDSTLSQLRAAELAMELGRPDEARAALAVFDRRWPTPALPPYLRERRVALLAASN